jgi:hypothetical protein
MGKGGGGRETLEPDIDRRPPYHAQPDFGVKQDTCIVFLGIYRFLKTL